MSYEAIRAATEAFDNAQNAYLANPSARNLEIYREAKTRRATLILDAFDDGLLVVAASPDCDALAAEPEAKA